MRQGLSSEAGDRGSLLPLDFEEPEFWLAGMKYRQHEPVWNGSIDTATDIRGVSAFGLVRSRLVAPSDLLIALTDLLSDSEFVARAHAARAIAAAGLPGCAALLRLIHQRRHTRLQHQPHQVRFSVHLTAAMSRSRHIEILRDIDG